MTRLDNYVIYDGIIKVITEKLYNDGVETNVYRKYVHGDLDETFITLGDIREEYPDADIITVIHEEALQGVIYEYGNHGEYWEIHGKTFGYA